VILIGKTLKILNSAFVLKKRVGPFRPTDLYFKVWPTDIDINLHMNNGRFLTIMDYGRFDYYGKLGLFPRMFTEKALPVTGAASVQFRRPLGLFSTYHLETRLVSLDEKWFYFDQKMFLSGELSCHLLVKVLWLKKGKKVSPKKVFQECFPRVEIPELSFEMEEWKKFEMKLKEGP
tara:strand:+ start:1249 stop:1776 length:528 start_codon:yes stop_codon:yes gene_type:complete